MRAWIPLTAAAALVAAAAVLVPGDGAAPLDLRPARAGSVAAVSEELVGEEPARQEAPVSELVREAPSDSRVAALPEVAAPPTSGGLSASSLCGSVWTASGRSLGGLPIDLRLPREDGPGVFYLDEQGPLWEESESYSTVHAARVMTTASGSFCFEDVEAAEGQRLSIGAGWLTQPITAEVDPALLGQVVELPGVSEQAGLLEVRLFDEAGEPLLIERVESRLVALAAPHPIAWTRHDPRSLFDQGTRVTLTDLAPGKWELWVFASGGGVARVEAQVVPHERTPVEVTLPRRSFVPRATLALEEGGEDVAMGDEESGFGTFEIKGQGLRALGDGGTDKNFRHTFRFAPGGVRAALLELDLEAASWADNDGVNLEYGVVDGKHRWAWGSRITSLPGAPSRWQRGARAMIQLDLASLPGKDGPVDLRGELQDGRLDVFVQDDTIVRAVRLLLDP